MDVSFELIRAALQKSAQRMPNGNAVIMLYPMFLREWRGTIYTAAKLGEANAKTSHVRQMQDKGINTQTRARYCCQTTGRNFAAWDWVVQTPKRFPGRTQEKTRQRCREVVDVAHDAVRDVLAVVAGL